MWQLSQRTAWALWTATAAGIGTTAVLDSATAVSVRVISSTLLLGLIALILAGFTRREPLAMAPEKVGTLGSPVRLLKVAIAVMIALFVIIGHSVPDPHHMPGSAVASLVALSLGMVVCGITVVRRTESGAQNTEVGGVA